MEIECGNLLYEIRDKARELYDAKSCEIEAKVKECVKKYFDKMQKAFLESGQLPKAAYSRCILLEDIFDCMEKHFLRKMGFMVGEEECSKCIEKVDIGKHGTVIGIPEIQGGTANTTAQKLYAEHVKRINEILQKDMEMLQRDGEAWTIVENVLNKIRQGDYEYVIHTFDPDRLKIYIELELHTRKSKESNYRFITGSDSFSFNRPKNTNLGRALLNYLQNYLWINGLREENEVDNLSMSLSVGEKCYGTYVEELKVSMLLTLPKK